MTLINREALLEEANGAAVEWRTQRALEILDELLVHNPADVEALRLKGHVLEMLGDLTRARPLYEEVLRLDPTNALALVDLADCEQEEDRAQEGLELLERALQIVEADPYKPDRDHELEEVLRGTYYCLRKLGRNREALATLARGAELLPASQIWDTLRQSHS